MILVTLRQIEVKIKEYYIPRRGKVRSVATHKARRTRRTRLRGRNLSIVAGRRGGGKDGGAAVFPPRQWRSGGHSWLGEVLQHRMKKGTVSGGSIGRKVVQ
jgi:hypothetical protein